MSKPAKKSTQKTAKVSAKSTDDQAALSALHDLEPTIRDVERAANIARNMTMHSAENPNDTDADGVALFAVEQCGRLATELREQFYRAVKGKAVQS
jgi:hypothetical protein